MKLSILIIMLTSILSITPSVYSESITIAGKKITIIQGDITQQKVAAIVNAANEQLAGGNGVCGAIFQAAGAEKLQAACNRFPVKNGARCPTGQAAITESFNLKSRGIRHIIHAVGPDCRKIKDTAERKKLLASAYENSLLLATTHHCASIAFPFISSAIYACPQELAVTTALETVKSYMLRHNDSPNEITFVLFTKEDFELFKTKLGAINEVGTEPTSSWFNWFLAFFITNKFRR